MSRRRIQLEGSLPWNPLLLLEAMGELFPKIVFKSEQEHIKIIKENGIKNSREWRVYYLNNNLKEQNYITMCWLSFGKSVYQFFDEIYGSLDLKEEDYISIMRENNITNGLQWKRYHEKNNFNKRDYLAYPWASFNKTVAQFFEEVNNNRSREDHVRFIKENSLTSSYKWCKYFLKHNLKKQKYHAAPWKFSDQTIQEFFGEVFGERNKNLEEHVQLAKENNIRNSGQWKRYHKNNNLKEQGYFANPWRSFKKTVSEFFGDLYVKYYIMDKK